MDGASRYVKTPKGMEELVARSEDLALPARRVLILADGRRDGAALAALFPDEDVAAILERLLAEGFIAPLATATAGQDSQPPRDDAQRFEMARNFMLNTTRTFLGVMGSSLIRKIEDCATFEDLRVQYAAWRGALQLSPDGRKRAGELESRLSALLS